MEEAKTMLAIKEAPPLDPKKIPTGMGGAHWIRGWISQFKTEFDRKVRRFCKPYKFYRARWLWKGSIASLYDARTIKFYIIKSASDFNDLADKNPDLLSIDPEFGIDIKLVDYRIHQYFDDEEKVYKKIFVKYEQNKSYTEADNVGDTTEAKLINALITWFARDNDAANSLTNSTDGTIKCLSDYFSSAHLNTQTDCLERGIELLDRKIPTSLQIFFFKGVFRHLDHFLENFKIKKQISKNDLWLVEARKEFKNLANDNSLQTQDKLIAFQCLFEKNFQDWTKNGVVAEELEACDNLYKNQEEYTPSMALMSLFAATLTMSQENFEKAFNIIPSKLKIEPEKVGLKELLDNRSILCQKIDKLEKRTEGYSNDFFKGSQASSTLAILSELKDEDTTVEEDLQYCRVFFKRFNKKGAINLRPKIRKIMAN